MKTVLTRLWQNGRLTEQALARAITRGWVTQEEANEIKTALIGRSSSPASRMT